MEDCLAAAERTLSIGEELHREHPAVRGVLLGLHGSIATAAAVNAMTGNVERAEELFRRSIALFDANEEAFHETVRYLFHQGVNENNLARLLSERGGDEEAVAILGRSIPRLATYRERYPDHDGGLFAWSNAHLMRGAALVRLERLAQARADAAELAAAATSTHWLVKSAELHARCGRAARERGDEELAAQSDGDALDVLERALAEGLTRAEVDEGGALSYLAEQPRYRAVLAALE
jgi:tetratricopeptide (TPR) repeat protein